MESPKTGILILVMLAVTTLAGGFLGWTVRPLVTSPQGATTLPAGGSSTDLLRATDDPTCFKPAIDSATDAQCLLRHREGLEALPAGVEVSRCKAWYRISYTYPHHTREGRAPEPGDWATGRLTESEIRFLLPAKK